jgi:putative transposase
MAYNPQIHHRRRVRLMGWDYARAWWYYVTVCSANRLCIFGQVKNDCMVNSDIGKIVEEEWLRTPIIRPEVELDAYVIMPNHVHAIIVINETRKEDIQCVGTHGRASLRRAPRSLGSLIAGFKAITTKRINMYRQTPFVPVWQGRFHDHIIRNDADLHCIRAYIANNPLQWSLDEENPDFRAGS